ncbi:hypothetical protein WJX81_002609 [Elliptochloris bilobata]|uniref:Ecdysoneless n=1 Tax=Elliptochloris bilobata TaxID=381761 RepID=A0AAW1QWU4_9CHLO
MDTLEVELPTTSENVVNFEVYGDKEDASPEDLSALRARCMVTLAPYLAGYPWQLDHFELYSSFREPPPWRQTGDRHNALPCIWGSMRFGDSIDDEWFTTWLLRELTRRIPGNTARVWDNDGEFLLIEAAYHLPRWLKPETAGNRVWLRGGALHLLPLPSASAPDLPSLPSAAQALRVLREGRVPTLASLEMQAALEVRLGAYPAQALLNRHMARAMVPAAAAAVLAAQPALAAPAVAAFYERTPQDMAAAARQRRFPPEALVTVVVPLSRCSYAQLAGSLCWAELREAAAAGFAAEAASRRVAAALAGPARVVDEVLAAPPDAEHLEQEMAGAEDDDAWMSAGAGELAAELAAREAEQGGFRGGGATDARAQAAFDPEQMAERVKAFLGGVSGLEGAEGGQGVSFDAAGFWAELGSSLGLPPGAAGVPEGLGDPGFGSDSDEASSFFSDDSADSQGGDLGADIGEVQQQQALRGGPRELGPDLDASPEAMAMDNRWEAATATDSDDEEADDADFDAAYASALAEQLAATRAGATFMCNPDHTPASDPGPGGQQGLPGPASTLAGLLGIRLPDDADA